MLPASIDWLQNPDRDPDECLAGIEQFVDYLFCEPLTVGKIFGSHDLDEVCQRVGRRNLERLGLLKPPLGDPKVAVYIATKLQASGGHTAALADMIRLSPKRRSIVVVTGVCGKTMRGSIARRFNVMSNTELVYAPAGGHLTKLTWLQKMLHEQAPATVWLFNHHQDSVSIAAVQPDRGYQLNFYHHGDDRLCLGVCLSFGAHYDTSPILFHNCRHVVKVQGNRYLPLAVADQHQKSLQTEGGDSGLVTCTAANFNKVEVAYFVQYIDIIPRLLCITGGRHIHIGRLTPLALWRLRRKMRKMGIPCESFVYLSYVPSVWQALCEYKVDLYLGSFPYGGGRTLVEVMGAGVPAVIHRNIADRMIGGLDIVYDGACTWREPEELYELLKNINRAFLIEQRSMARAWYEKYHSDKVFADSIANQNATVEVPKLKPDYMPDPLLYAWQIAHEVTLSGVLKRQLWRFYRRLKAIIGRAPLKVRSGCEGCK